MNVRHTALMQAALAVLATPAREVEPARRALATPDPGTPGPEEVVRHGELAHYEGVKLVESEPREVYQPLRKPFLGTRAKPPANGRKEMERRRRQMERAAWKAAMKNDFRPADAEAARELMTGAIGRIDQPSGEG